MTDVVNVIVAMVFVFLVFSLVVSGINEGLSALFAIRSKVLWKTINDFGRGLETPAPIWRLRDVIMLPLTRFSLPKRVKRVVDFVLRKLPSSDEPKQPKIHDARPDRQETRKVAELDRAGVDGEKVEVSTDLVQWSAALVPALILAKTRPFDTGSKKTRVKEVTARTFSEALIDVGVHESVVTHARGTIASDDPAPPPATVTVDASVAANPLPSLSATLEDTLKEGQDFLEKVLKAVNGTELEKPVRAAIAEAQGDVAKFRGSIEEWFDSQMRALSGLFRMWSRWVMLVIGLMVAAVMNFNPITAVIELRDDSALAELTAQEAAAFIADATGFDDLQTFCSAQTPTDSAKDQLETCYSDVEDFVSNARTLPPPLEFDGVFWDEDEPIWGWSGYVLGVILGGVAISFGAPFWFDALRKVTSFKRQV